MSKNSNNLAQSSCVLVALFTLVQNTQAALPIDIEIVTEAGAPITAPQQWVRLLGGMDLGRVRIRSSHAGDQLDIQQNGKRYQVVALLSSQGDLVVDGKRYRVSDRQKLKAFFKALVEDDSFGQEKGVFGLTQKEFSHVYADLSRPIDFPTAGQSRMATLTRIVETLAEPVEYEAGLLKQLQRSPSIESELQGLSAGTGLAILLREADLILRPKKPLGKAPQLFVERKRPRTEGWPVGWKIEGSPRKAAPKMFEFLTVEIDGYKLDQALEALKPRMEIPLLFDQQVLRRKEIALAEIDVKLLPKKTYLKKSIDRLLSHAHLACELRADERGQVFCWVTRFGRESRRAE